MAEQKFFSSAEIAKIYGLNIKTVRKHCRSSAGKQFAFKPFRGANYRIDGKKFEAFMKTYTA